MWLMCEGQREEKEKHQQKLLCSTGVGFSFPLSHLPNTTHNSSSSNHHFLLLRLGFNTYFFLFVCGLLLLSHSVYHFHFHIHSRASLKHSLFWCSDHISGFSSFFLSSIDRSFKLFSFKREIVVLLGHICR